LANDPTDDVSELLKLIEDSIEVPIPQEIQKMVAKRKEELENKGIVPTRAIGKCDAGKEEPVLCIGKTLKTNHPVFNNLVDRGNLSNYLNDESTGIPQMTDELYGDPNSDKALALAQNLREIIRSKSAEYVACKLTQSEKGIRPAMMPGSVSRDEAVNLYYGDESYSADDTVQLALTLLKSIKVGQNVSVYFENGFGDYINEISKHGGFDMEDIGATKSESSYPFVTLVHLLIFVYEKAGEDRSEVEQLMLQTGGVLYLTPGTEHEKYMTFAVPSLRAFLHGWLMDEKKRNSLKKMFKAANGIGNGSFARNKEVRGDLDKMYNYLEIIATHLIDNGSIPWQTLRQLIDSLISEAFDLDARWVYLGFVRDMVD